MNAFQALKGWLFEEKFRISDLFFLGIYGAVIGFGIWHHEPWSDEALPWMLVRESTLPELIFKIFQGWDRHPGLFHLLLIPFVKGGSPYESQALLNAGFSIAAAVLFLMRAPFPRFFRYLFLFSFYMIYEYSVIVRPYMLCILLLFAIASFFSRRNSQPLLYALLVALFFQSDFVGFGLGVGLAVVFFFENRGLLKKDLVRQASFVLMAASGWIAFWIGHALPAEHYERGKEIIFQWENILTAVANACFPFSELNLYPGIIHTLAVIGGLCWVGLAGFSVRKKREFFVILVFSFLYLFSVFSFLHPGDYRHHGFILFTIVFVLWIEKSSRSQIANEEKKAPQRTRVS